MCLRIARSAFGALRDARTCAIGCAFLLASSAAALQPPHTATIAVSGPRPLAVALDALQERYGWVVTYEDPRFAYSGDVEDVAQQVARLANPRVRGIVPRGGLFTFEYDVPTGGVPDARAVLEAMLDSYERSGYFAGRFVLTHSGGMFHVVPIAVRDVTGREVAQQSILDAKLTFPTVEGNLVEIFGRILGEISSVTGAKVQGGPTGNYYLQARARASALNEPARDVLVRTLNLIDRPLTWRLFYDPGLRSYALNVRAVEQR